MEDAFLSEKFRQALDEYKSYNEEKLYAVILYMREAEKILELNKNSLNHDELKTLVSKCRKKIVDNNTGLLIKITREFSPEDGPHYDDFFQEAVIGLLKAIPKYDPERGKFANYAGISIRQNIRRRMHETLENIRVPLNSYFHLKKMRILSGMFKERYKRIPSDEELAEFSGESIKKIKHLQRITTLLKTKSLDEKIREEDKEKRCLIDYYVNPSDSSPEEECLRKIISEQIRGYANNIPNKEDRTVLFERLSGKTLGEIAIERNITRERVRQREKRAIKRARRIREFSRLRYG